MSVSSAPRHLLIIGCSNRKRKDERMLPALDRYDGVNYRVLQRSRREGRWPTRLDILIVSAEYGLLSANDMIPDYDRLMTLQRASELRTNVGMKLDLCLEQQEYGDVFINLGKTYLPAIQSSRRLRSQPHVTYAVGRIGEKMSQMKRWLDSCSAPS